MKWRLGGYYASRNDASASGEGEIGQDQCVLLGERGPILA
jgi:hypothetical protein